jgi:hypothetical protein
MGTPTPLLDVIPRIAATACHQSNDVERYSRYNTAEREGRVWDARGTDRVPARAGAAAFRD